MKSCDLVNYGIDAIVTEAQVVEDFTDMWLDQRVQIDPNHKSIQSTRFFKHFINLGLWFEGRKQKKDLDPVKLRKEFGELSDREYIAGQIRTTIAANPQLAEAIVEDLFLEVTAMDLKLKKDVFETDKTTGEKKLHLYRLPVKPLTRLLHAIENWSNADPSKVDTKIFRGVWLPWGTTRKMRYNDKSGAYHNVWKATQNFADRQGAHIKRFMDPEEGTGEKEVTVADKKGKPKKVKRPVRTVDVAKGKHGGMQGILNAVQRLYQLIPNESLNEWLSKGFYGGRSQQHAEANLMELFSWMMHGRIENISEERAKKMTKGTEDKPAELIYKHGPGVYIYTQHAPTRKKHKSTGDVIFGWQKPVPLKYDPEIHGTEENMKIRDHMGRERYDTLNLIQNSVPITGEIFNALNDLATEARPIIDESHMWFNNQTEASFAAILDALEAHFPNKNRIDLERAFVEGLFFTKDGKHNWTKEEKAQFNFLEDNFTKWSLQAPFKPTTGLAAYKERYYPYIFMPETYTLLLQDAIDSLEFEQDRVESAFNAAKGERKTTLGEQLSYIRASLINQEEMKEQMLKMDSDDTDGDKMVTRTQSKHFKHISNAFDILKSRNDSSVFRDSITHSARTIESNHLTAALIRSLSMTESEGWRNAFISLYRGTLGRTDTRSLFAGVDVSDARFTPKQVRMMKAVRKYWNFMLSKPTTAMRQYFGHFEKYNKTGLLNTLEAFSLYARDKQELEPLIQESGIVLFEDFFTNAIVSELETLEADRDTINAMASSYIKYFNDRNKGKGKKDAADTLYNELTKLFGRPMNWEKVLNEQEARDFDSKLKAQKIQRISNKITNWAISNEVGIREVLRQNPITGLGVKGIDVISALRNMMGSAAIMSQAEKVLRITSFILGVRLAQRSGIIKAGPIHELSGDDRILAIEYGRKATNLMFDFSMSRQGVGESYRSAFGSVEGQFSVWKSQKAASDVDLWKHAVLVFNNSATPIPIVKALKDVFKSDKLLERTNPDALKLKRWLKGQFLIEGMIQVMMVSSLLPFMVGEAAAKVAKYGFYATGARNMSAAGSPIAGLIWGAIIMMATGAMKSFGDDPWDDEREMERYISHQFRNIPGVGVGEGLAYDGSAALLAMFLEQENIANDKISNMAGYVMPIPIAKELLQAGVKAVLPKP